MNHTMLPEEEELHRITAAQTKLEEEVAQAELALNTERVEAVLFQRRYYETVGRLYAEIDEVDAQIAAIKAGTTPEDLAAKEEARAAREKAERSKKETAQIAEAPAAAPATPELKTAYRQAAMRMHPDRATTESERKRRTEFMAQVNVAYERGDLPSIQRLIQQFGEDPEALQGDDIGTQMIKAIRRVAQLKRRLAEIATDLSLAQQGDIADLKRTVAEAEALGGDPLRELALDLLKTLSERRIALEMLRLDQMRTPT